jgi:hypothetical protein
VDHHSRVFDLDEEGGIRDFFRAHGYVAVRGVLSEEECLETYEDVNAQMKRASPAFDLFDPETYSHAPVSAGYAMFSRGPIFSRCFLLNRQHPNVYRAFCLLYDDADLLVSHDRCAFYRPTRGVRLRAGVVDRPEWKTEYTYPGVHLDFNPNVYRDPARVVPPREALSYVDEQDWVSENNMYCAADGLQVQAVLNLEDNREQDGGFHGVPGFHTRFDEWLAGFSSDDRSPAGLYRFSPHVLNDSRHLGLPVRVPVPAGALILWDQRLAHGTRPNDSDRGRLIQFLKMFPRRIVSRARYLARQRAMQAVLDETGFAEITEVGRTVFGLRPLPAGA